MKVAPLDSKVIASKFLLELSLQMKKRLPLDENGIIAKLNVLCIEIALDLKRSPTSIVPLAVHFPIISYDITPQNKLNELDDQWRAFRILKKNLLFLPNVFRNIGTI